MKKRFIPTIVALVILIVLAIYSNKYEVEEIANPGHPNPVSLLDCNENDIKSISFGKVGSYSLKVELNPPASKITQPALYSSDNAEVYGIVRHFSELKSESHFPIEKGVDISTYGFNQDSHMVKFELATRTVELTLGNKMPYGNSFYLKRENDTNIYIVPAHIQGSFNKSLTTLRNHALYDEDFGIVNEIQYQCGSITFKLVLDSKNSEWLISDTKYSADNMEVANLINNMRNLKITHFEDGNVSDEKYCLTSPNLKILMKNEFGKEFSFIAGTLQGTDIYVSSDGKSVQKANTLKVNELRLTLNNVRDKYLDIFPLKEIIEINVSDATGTLIINKEKDNWVNNDKIIKEADVKDFINSMTRSKVTEYAEKQNLDAVGLNDMDKCSKIVLKTKDKSLNYWLGDVKGIALFMMDENEVIQINSGLSDAFNKFMYRVRSSELKIK